MNVFLKPTTKKSFFTEKKTYQPIPLKKLKKKMTKKVCLNMIVKNESNIIGRCLSSVEPFVDCYVIHDTGSDDGTPDIIRSFFDQHGKKGKVVETQFKDFEHNRNLALQDAMKWPSVDYILLIDADMLLHTSLTPNEFWDSLEMDAYKICQKSSLVLYNLRILGKNCFKEAKYLGVTHEYLHTGANSTGIMDGEKVFMRDFGDGGCKQDKFIRDQKLLEKDTAENPTNARSWFYLAQTYKDIGKNSRAISAYERYLELHSWDEERFMARYMIGYCYLCMGNTAKGFEECAKAWEMRPTRAEPLYHMVKACRENSRHHLGYTLAKKGTEICFPVNDVLFVESNVYTYLFWYELSILTCYTHPEKGLAICDYLLMNRKILSLQDDLLIQNIKRNMFFYFQSLPVLKTDKITLPNPPENYNGMNPSIMATTENTFLLNVRFVNYVMTEDMQYTIHDGTYMNDSNPAITKNFWVEYTPNQKSWSEGTELKPTWKGEFYPDYTRGFEDVRVFSFAGETYACCNSRYIVESRINSIALIEPDGNVCLVDSPFPGKFEKNWLFFERRGDDGVDKMCFVYSYAPLRIYEASKNISGKTKANDDAKEKIPQRYSIKLLHSKEYDFDFQDFRGSAGPLPVEYGEKKYYLIIVHEVLPSYGGLPRRYIHRFLLMERSSFEVCFVSMPFTLRDSKKETRAIQYVSGVALDGENLIITWGNMDCEAYMSFCNLEKILDFATANIEVGKPYQKISL